MVDEPELAQVSHLCGTYTELSGLTTAYSYQPTHRNGHILDLIVLRAEVNINNLLAYAGPHDI